MLNILPDFNYAPRAREFGLNIVYSDQNCYFFSYYE